MTPRPATLADLAAQALEAATAPQAPEPCRLWSIRHPDGSQASHAFCPPATLAEVRGWYPGAEVEPEPDPAPEVAVLSSTREPVAPPVPAVACRTCTHWRRDTVGDGSGFGACLIHAPASREPGSLWPGSTPHCKLHLETAL